MATTRPRGTAGPEEPTASPSAPDDAPGSGAEDLISPENRAILHHALEEAARLLRSDGAIAYLADPASGVMRFADDAGIADPDLRAWVRTLRVTAGSGLVGRAVWSGAREELRRWRARRAGRSHAAHDTPTAAA